MIHVFTYWLMRYRRTWRASIVMSVGNPLLFLIGVGAGLGHLVDHHGAAQMAGVSYAAFFAPGLLAAAAMQTAFLESSGQIARAAAPDGAYQSTVSTPLSRYQCSVRVAPDREGAAERLPETRYEVAREPGCPVSPFGEPTT